ncbi:GNAT family N-acetyltransferase [Streptococcus equinus]|uniref:GNAT family N-acetyltransferase n=1 Tax=Streptococcus equinus TaxID=1335 RepID=UPI0008E6B5CC|nr:GNAT family N-acetyltransferase [Streptococcus equinus]SFB83268.1 L-amino acid N-acyltransferase YncA [Streptococcus equinus]
MIEVREVTVKDAKNLLEFCNQVGSETDNLSYGSEGMRLSVAEEEKILAKFQNDKMSYFLLAEESGQIVGTCNCRSFRKKRLSHRAEIGIAVKKAYWNKGIGRKLLTRLINLSRQSGLKILSLEVRTDNKRAIHLYESLGFRRIGTFEGFMEIDGESVDFDIMELFLEKS